MRPTYLPKKNLWVVDTLALQRLRQADQKSQLEKRMRKEFGWHLGERLTFRVGNGPEIGDIDDVMSGFARSGLTYHLWNSRTRRQNYPEAAHSFNEVLHFLAEDPVSFEVQDFIDEYSQQELVFLAAVKKRYAELDSDE